MAKTGGKKAGEAPAKEAGDGAAGGGDEAGKTDFEDRLPAWQKHLNIFCENWIFAVLVALLIRHFLLEPFRIPTASMEPMLYGDPALTQGDFVVVDKLTTRFSAPERFDVIVFQYPVPEVDTGSPEPELAEWGPDLRVDGFPFRPLYERNFVKRCLVLPGEVFYLANGDLFVRGDDGIFRVAPKPAKIQRALWLPIYRQGAQEGYLPWEATGGAAVEGTGERFTYRGAAQGAARFTQPFTNFYLKPGRARVRSKDQQDSGLGSHDVQVSMLAPLFEVTSADGSTRTGNIWDLDDWWVSRLTTADFDDKSRGRELNGLMDEYVGDVRVAFTVGGLDGPVVLHLDEGERSLANRVQLHLAPAGWRLVVNGEEVAAAEGDPTGREFALWTADDRCGIHVDGEEQLGDGVALTAFKPVKGDALVLYLAGEGTVSLDGLGLHRDVHYSTNGFLADESQTWIELNQQLKAVREANFASQANEIQKYLYRYRRLREQVIPCLVDEGLRARREQSLQRSRDNWNDTAWLRPLGVDEETALRAPENGYLMLGDNSPLSMDGRNWGWVPAKNIRGRVLWVAFPFGRMRVVR